MGTDKSFVLLAGKPLIAHVIERVSALGVAVNLITNRPDDYRTFGLPTFPDVIPGKGSLGGLYSALVHSATPYTLCVACDMPFLNAELLAYLIGLREGVDVVVPRIDGRPEPLHAVYGKTCVSPTADQITREALKIGELYRRLQVRFVDEPDLRRFDPLLRSCININTPADLSDAQPG